MNKGMQVCRPLWARPMAWVVVTTAWCLGSQAWAQGGAPLGADLTPAGAERASTTSGIPAWSPSVPAAPGWSYGKKRGDFFVYKADKPLYIVDGSNVAQYEDKLSPGQVAVIKSIKGYRMDVYPSRRTCNQPDFVAANTKKNVGFAQLSKDGFSLQDAYLPGIPFPQPKNGAEVIWNAKMHYRGVGLEQRSKTSAVSPRKGSTDWISIVGDSFLYYPWGVKSGTTFADVGRVEGALNFTFLSPAALAGQAAVITTNASGAQETFYYFPGQRRTRRMPSYSYDAPQIGFENQFLVDESYVFSGSLDRFDWKLVGKREMLVPYNSFGPYDFTAKHSSVALQDFIAPQSRRYELHRVWVVEATVRPGARHSAPKRLFYIDEDSWNLVGAVDYDARGSVSKVREAHLIPVYETGTCDAMALVQYSLADGRYLFDFNPVGAGVDFRWVVDPGGNRRMKLDYYTADNLRATSER